MLGFYYFGGKRIGLLGTFPHRAFFSHLLLSGLANSPASLLKEFRSPPVCLILGKKILKTKTKPPNPWQQGVECRKEQEVASAAGHSWHWVAPCKNTREPSRIKKDNKDDSLPRPRLLFPGEQTVGDSRAGAPGKQALHCAMPMALRAGFVCLLCWHPAVAQGGCQQHWHTPQCLQGLGLGWKEGREERGSSLRAPWLYLCSLPGQNGVGERRACRWVSSGFKVMQAALCRGHAGGHRDRGSPATCACDSY